jgi:hypothetical protein
MLKCVKIHTEQRSRQSIVDETNIAFKIILSQVSNSAAAPREIARRNSTAILAPQQPQPTKPKKTIKSQLCMVL